jgi:hypothetical protein
MDVIFHAADNDGLTIEMGQDAIKIMMQFMAQCAVAQERTAFFG